MPHKHKRKRDENDEKTNFNLAPSTHAKSLPTYKVPSIFTTDVKSNKRRKPSANGQKSKVRDDTPKQFARMMAWQAAGKVPSGLDNGTKPAPPADSSSKKAKPQPPQPSTHKSDSDSDTLDAIQQPKTHKSKKSKSNLQDPTPESKPTILPGESLSSFAARVDRSLPLSALRTSNSTTTRPDIPSDIKPQTRLTKHNKRLQRMIADWHVEDAKIKAKRLDDGDGGDDESISGISDEEGGGANGKGRGIGKGEMMARSRRDGKRDVDGVGRELSHRLWDDVRAAKLDRKGKKKKMALKGLDDPWKGLERKRKKAAISAGGGGTRERQKGGTSGDGLKRRNGRTRALVGVHDVVQAPPTELKKLDLKRLKGLV